MKKLIPIILIVVGIYFSQQVVGINHKIYISSLYLSYEEDYELVLFSPSSSSVGKSNSKSEEEDLIIKQNGSSLEQVFNKAEGSTDYELNYRQINSIILNNNFLKEDYIDKLIEFILNTLYLDLDFFLFSTKESGEDIFDFDNPDSSSNYFSLLTITSESLYLFNFVSPLRFSEFLRMYDKSYYTIKFPTLVLSSDFLKEEESKNLKLNELTIFSNNESKTYKLEDNISMIYLNEYDNAKFYLSDLPVVINKVSINMKMREYLNVNIKVKYDSLLNTLDKDDLYNTIYQGIINQLNKFYQEGIDYLYLDDINNKYNKSYTIDLIKINLSFLT